MQLVGFISFSVELWSFLKTHLSSLDISLSRFALIQSFVVSGCLPLFVNNSLYAGENQPEGEQMETG